MKVLRYRRRDNRFVSRCRLRVERGHHTLGHLVGRTKVAAGPLVSNCPAGCHQELPRAGRLHPFGAAEGARHRLTGQCPRADGRCGVGGTGSGQHSPARDRDRCSGRRAPCGASGARGEHLVGGRVRRREEREAALAVALAPGATRPVGAGDRVREEAPDPFRLCFERDLDRMKHRGRGAGSRASARCSSRPRTTTCARGSHTRSRLRRSQPVSPGARVVCAVDRGDRARARLRARSRRPHVRRSVLSIRPRRLRPRGVRRRRHAPALNLCRETLDGVRNHSWRRPPPCTPEGEVVAWADRIAYVCHDFEDAVRAGILTPDDLPADIADVVGRRRRNRSAFSCTRCSMRSTPRAWSG